MTARRNDVGDPGRPASARRALPRMPVGGAKRPRRSGAKVPAKARLMLVGEQPGDREDLAGRPFIGPAGHLLDDALLALGLATRAALCHQRRQAFQVRIARQAPHAQDAGPAGDPRLRALARERDRRHPARRHRRARRHGGALAARAPGEGARGARPMAIARPTAFACSSPCIRPRCCVASPLIPRARIRALDARPGGGVAACCPAPLGLPRHLVARAVARPCRPSPRAARRTPIAGLAHGRSLQSSVQRLPLRSRPCQTATNSANLVDLHQRGILSDEEFARAKARVLDGMPAARAHQPAGHRAQPAAPQPQRPLARWRLRRHRAGHRRAVVGVAADLHVRHRVRRLRPRAVPPAVDPGAAGTAVPAGARRHDARGLSALASRRERTRRASRGTLRPRSAPR